MSNLHIVSELKELLIMMISSLHEEDGNFPISHLPQKVLYVYIFLKNKNEFYVFLCQINKV